MNKKEDKLIVKTKHLDMYKTEKGFYYCQRRSVNSIAVLCFKKVKDDFFFLIRLQPMPQVEEKKVWSQLYPCPITGSIEQDESPETSAVREVLEEGGITINENDLIAINPSVATTQMNEKVFYYLADVTNKKIEAPQNDGSIFEAVSENIWVSQKELETIINNDLYLSSLLTCYYYFLKLVK
ncbi:MAG: NUDIX domain-containing protein [Malacoplasma sp.]|nr:NUDIX domain-containing protein [Malacoplasma sp.]MDE6646059.1 NUDIX domain-containing protein [Malacoplasma sp.]MDE6894421.1 NUDIX domain-containing protein [Malacoplasma sp.]MDE7075393.1 NUDIX domain-containing protein [Malacoplasma sp.]